MTYSLVSISNPTLASGSLQGTTLTLNAGAISGNSNITVRATTPNGLFTEDTFILNIVQAGQTANQTVTIDLSNGRTAQQIETELRTAIQNANANGFHTNILFTLGNQDRVVEISQTAPIEILTHIKFFGPTDGYALTIKRVAGDQRVFTVAPNAKAEFSDLTIRGGRRQLGDGAGIWNAGELILNRVTLTDNVASNGYGAGLFNASLAIVTLGNVTLSGNQTQKWGAGIFNRGTLSADHVTFASNTAERGAAFFNEGTMNLFASLVADGVDGSHPHTELAVGTVTSRGFNVVTNAYGTTGFSAASDKLGGISGLPFTRANLFKALTLDERTGFLRRSSEFMEEDQAEITVNFTSVPGNETHSDGHPWFPIATVQLDADSVLKLRLESLSGQVAVDGFKLVPHISKETFTYDNENRLLETQTYTQSSTSPAVITSYLYDPMGRLIVTNTDVVDKSTTQIGTIYQGQKPVLQFDMDPDLGNEIQSFKWFDSRGELIASHVNTTHSSQQPHPDELAATWHLNQLDGSEFTNTKSWMATEYVFAANKRGTVNSDPITELQKSTRSWHEGRYALSVESQEAAYRSWADPAHEILNYVGIIDPTGIADGINAVWYVGEGLMGREGAFLNAGISAAGALLPYAGDLLKFGKAGVQAAEACGAIKKLETNVILRQSAKSAAIGAASGAAIGGGISYAAGGDVWHGATQGALHGAVGGFSRNFFLNRYAKACFTAGTPLVVDLEGNSKPIEQIEVGEMVLARNEFEPNGPLELKRVEELFTRTSPIIELEIGGQKIGTTDEHPFYVPAREAFVPARELQVGDQLISHDGQLLRIDAIQSTLQIATVYNLRVTDYHTYFVGCDEWGWSVWAHNAKCGPALVNSREFRESHTRIFGDAGSSGHPTIIAQLQKHANTAAQRAKYTERQLASIQRSKNRAAAATDVAQREKHLRIAARKEKLFMGTQVDTEFKTLVADDPMIKSLGLSITPRGRFGPDIYDAKTKDYWELTTKADWLRGTHQNRYNGHFANGTGVFWS